MNKRALIAAAALLTAGTANAASITYQVDETIGAGTAVGSITTDGTVGTLVQPDILDWTLTLTNPNLNGGVPDPISLTSGATVLLGNDLTATPSTLLFDFSGTDLGGIILLGSDGNGVCFLDSVTICSGGAFTAGPGQAAMFVTSNAAGFDATNYTGTQTIGTVPEPATLGLLGLGIAGVGFTRRRRKH